MKSPIPSRRPKPAVTRRLITCVVREDPLPVAAFDHPQSIRDFWLAVVAAQPDHEPDKESLVVILVTARLRPFAWHRVSLGTVNATSAHPREILRPVITGARPTVSSSCTASSKAGCKRWVQLIRSRTLAVPACWPWPFLTITSTPICG